MLRACVELGVERLVYTSSINVVFCGLPIAGLHLPEALPGGVFTDPYSRSKALAERLVLACNGLPLKRPLSPSSSATSVANSSQPVLRTCALRAGGIYGEVQRMFRHS